MDAVLGALQQIMPGIAFVWGLLVKYHPNLKAIPNASIPYLNAGLMLVTGLVGPGEAHAAGFLGLGGGTFLAHIFAACWQSIQVSLVYEILGRHPIEKGLGVAKPR